MANEQPVATLASSSEKAAQLQTLEKWFREVVIEGKSLPASTYVTPDELRAWGYPFPGVAPVMRELDQGYFHSSCRCFDPVELAMVVSAGEDVLPFLIRQLDHEGLSPCVFQHPLSSHIDLRPPRWSVSGVASYLIEAILQEKPYFTWSGWLVYPTLPGLSDDDGAPETPWEIEQDEDGRIVRKLYDFPVAKKVSERRQYMFRLAAEEYKRWFESCFDQASQSILSPCDWPAVPWDDAGLR